MNAPRQGSLNPGDLGSDVFELQIGGQSIPVTAIPNVKTAEYPSLADEYRRMPSYCWIHPSNFMGVHYAWFESDEPLQAVITCPEPITRYSILPSGAAHDAIDGKRLTLSLGMHEPRYFVVQIDDYPPLVLVIDPVERDVPDREASYVFDLGTVLTDGASPADQSAALEDSFRKASKDGKIAYIPAGTYHLGPVRLHHLNRAKIYFARGSVLRTEVSPTGQNIHSHGLWVQDSEDIHIYGRGCLDHQAYGNFAHGRNAYNHGLISYYVTNDLCPFTTQSPLFMVRCQRVNVEGFMIRNGRNMNINLRHCDDVTFRHCKILTPPASTPEYGDGFNINSSNGIRIENCLAYCNDDCFASGHYFTLDGRDSGSHHIQGLVGWNPRANGVRLGFYSFFDQGDYRFENCHFGGITYCGIVIHPLQDTPETHRFPRYGTVSFKDCEFQCGRLTDALIDMDHARMHAFELHHTSFDRLMSMQIHGHGPQDGVDRALFDRVTVGGVELARSDVDSENAHVEIR